MPELELVYANLSSPRFSFIDRYDEKCSIQKSNLATEDAIWLGIDETKPIVMAREHPELDPRPISDPERGTGWLDVPIPEDASCCGRMHLTLDMVRMLLPYLHHFVETGELV